jgi:hypothetical protein
MSFLLRTTSGSAAAAGRSISVILNRRFGGLGARLSKESDLGESYKFMQIDIVGENLGRRKKWHARESIADLKGGAVRYR